MEATWHKWRTFGVGWLVGPDAAQPLGQGRGKQRVSSHGSHRLERRAHCPFTGNRSFALLKPDNPVCRDWLRCLFAASPAQIRRARGPAK